MCQIVCAHSEKVVTLHCLKEKDLFRITNLRKVLVMFTLVVVALVAATVAQAVKLGHQIDANK